MKAKKTAQAARKTKASARKTASKKAAPLFTIGYEKSTPDALMKELKRAKVSLLVDTRAVAASRKPGFSKRQLAATLDENGIAYLHLQNTRLSCLNLDTGVETWRPKERFGDYWSLVAQSDRVLALDETGGLILFRANPQQFDELDRRSIGESSTWAHLAVAGDQLFVRELNGLMAFKWK